MLQNPAVVQALAAGTAVAVLCGFAGVFVVMRHQAFAGHAVTDVGFAGGAGAPLIGAPLIGAPPLAGLLAFSVVAALVMSRLGDRARERDVATGVVLTAALGIGSLFLFIQTRYVSEPAALLFGSIFAVQPAVLTDTVWIGALCAAALLALYRPLVLCTVSRETAAAKGIRVGFVDAAFMVLMAVAVAEAAQLVGVLLTTALLIGPASVAVALARRIPIAIITSVVVALTIMWLSIVLAYASYGWPPGGKGWPVSFFVGFLTLGLFGAAQVRRALTRS